MKTSDQVRDELEFLQSKLDCCLVIDGDSLQVCLGHQILVFFVVTPFDISYVSTFLGMNSSRLPPSSLLLLRAGVLQLKRRMLHVSFANIPGKESVVLEMEVTMLA